MSESVLVDDRALMERMTRPSAAVQQAVAGLQGDILILGVGGKMGPSLAELLVRAGAPKVIGVARFSDLGQRQYLDGVGVETVQADLLDEAQLAGLPEAPNIFLLAGFKFGATGNEDTTWAMNTWLPGQVLRRYPDSRVVYVSSGNVYKYTGIDGTGAAEGAALDPIGEYAQSRLGGERVAQYWSRVQQTRLAIVRLFYATELRYGIIHDIAWKVWQGEPIDLAMGHVNQIWQGDANSYLAQAFPLCASPAAVVNLTGPEILSVRQLAQQLGRALGRQPQLVGQEEDAALLGDSRRLSDQLGRPETAIDEVVEWMAHWVRQGGTSLGKPTKYESRSGEF
ncbi:MAG: NAD-dependent epimerase/dehydratase family protein [Candidatus Latescibacteria bacterium]|nr:NAD-dependent epimerase/dehydratase family protein [Candidatus Latescibacterota bacterium]